MNVCHVVDILDIAAEAPVSSICFCLRYARLETSLANLL